MNPNDPHEELDEILALGLMTMFSLVVIALFALAKFS